MTIQELTPQPVWTALFCLRVAVSILEHVAQHVAGSRCLGTPFGLF